MYRLLDLTNQNCYHQIDYVANANFVYTFTSRTSELSIVTRLEQDRAGESIESFTICLPDPSAFQTMGTDTVEVVDPRCTTVTIIDDDCK